MCVHFIFLRKPPISNTFSLHESFRTLDFYNFILYKIKKIMFGLSEEMEQYLPYVGVALIVILAIGIFYYNHMKNTSNTFSQQQSQSHSDFHERADEELGQKENTTSDDCTDVEKCPIMKCDGNKCSI